MALIGREGSLNDIVHWYIDIFNDTGTLHALSEHAVVNPEPIDELDYIKSGSIGVDSL